jgi:hypothetical protein
MGFYTCYKVECIVKPECVDIIKDFINNGYQWIINNDPIYDCIREWHNFLILHNNVLIYWTDSNNGYKKCAHYNPLIHDKLELLDKYIDYYNNPPNGPKSRWGQYCLLEKKKDKYIWRFTGEIKNYNNDIEFFFTNVVACMSDNIFECLISNEDYDLEYEYSDNEIRNGFCIY